MTSRTRDSIRVGPAKAKTTKAWAPRSRSGCMTCRARRVKCDEAKPSCRRCITTGSTCQYHGVVQSPEAPTSPGLIKIEPSGQPAPIGISSTRKELQIFDLFRKEIVFNISGVMDDTFWTTDVLQATRIYPAIWHSCLALAAIQKRDHIPDQRLVDSDQRHSLYLFAIQQYNLAIRQISDIMHTGATSYAQRESCLLACVMFAGISSLLGDSREAAVHVNGALRLYYEWEFDREIYEPSPDNKTSLRLFSAHSLNNVVTRGEIQLLTWLSGVHTPPKRQMRGWPKCSPDPFRNAREAYLELHPIASSLMKEWGTNMQRFQGDGTKQRMAMVMDLSYELSVWKKKLNALQAHTQARSKIDPGMGMVETAWIALDVTLSAVIGAAKGIRYNFNAEYKRIVEIYETQIVIELSRRQKKQGYGIPFSFTSNICEMLALVGMGCRNTDLRRRALRLMQQWPQKDGLYDTRLLEAICNARIEIEESGIKNGCPECIQLAEADVCPKHRVGTSSLEFIAGNRASLTLKTFRDMQAGESGKMLQIEW